MALDDLLARLEQGAGTAGTADVPVAVPVNPLQTLGGTAGTAGTSEKDNDEMQRSDQAQACPSDEPAKRVAEPDTLRIVEIIAAERGMSVSTAAVSKPVSTRPGLAAERSSTDTTMLEVRTPVRSELRVKQAARCCPICRHRATPGRAFPGYCAERDDLPPAYGRDHPLHKLPDDGGTNCPKWAPHE